MKVAPFGLDTDAIRRELSPLRSDFSVAVCRAKNPFNVGAIIRVAHSFLVREIFLIGTEPYYERAAMGMQKYETIVELPDERSFLGACREVLAIPMYGINHSYPVAIAAGMVLCEWARRRDPRAR